MKRIEVTTHLAAFILAKQCNTPVSNAYHLPQAWINYCR